MMILVVLGVHIAGDAQSVSDLLPTTSPFRPTPTVRFDPLSQAM